MSRAPRWTRPALITGGALVGWALIVALTGGFRIESGTFVLSATSVYRPLVPGAVLVVIALAYVEGAFVRRVAESRIPRAFAVALALITFGLGIAYGTFVAGGPDPYGYVSQAARWRQGTLISTAPYVAVAPWATPAFAPIGYVAGARPGEIVPQYPPGLPMVMAAFQAVGGERAAYYVVPLTGALAVWLTYQLGTALGGSLAGAIAAATLFASPIFLFQLMFPMSDVPVTALWLAAFLLALRDRSWTAATSGAAAALAVLVRPNLAVLGAVVFVLALSSAVDARARLRRAVIWGLPAMVGPLVVALLQYRFYGSPFKSGYGETSGLFAIGYVWTNIARYGGWLMERQTPYILLGLIAVPLLSRAGAARQARAARWALVFSAVVAASYLLYLPFPDWYFLRFLLPAFPMLLATAATVLVQLGAARKSRTLAAAAAVVVIVTGYCLARADTAFQMRQDQSRYRAAAVEARSLPQNAIVIGNLHTGSLQYYANLQTVRFEWISPNDYQRTIMFLESLNRPLFVMLDNLELDDFRARYGRVTDLGWLDEPMRIINERVRLYQLRGSTE